MPLNRRRFLIAAARAQFVGPRQPQLANVGCVDLFQRAEAGFSLGQAIGKPRACHGIIRGSGGLENIRVHSARLLSGDSGNQNATGKDACGQNGLDRRRGQVVFPSNAV